jgi:methionine-gamma-lyase
MELSSLIAKENFNKNQIVRPHQLPIYATSSFEFEDIAHGIDVFAGNQSAYFYSRYANPTIDAVADKIAALEGFGLGKDLHGVMVSSGMAAISTLMMGVLKSGDKVLTQGNLYGGTTELFNKVLQPLGITAVYIDLTDDAAVTAALAADAAIRLIYFETPANPTLQCVDIAKLVAFAKSYGVVTVCDNTFCTPYLQQPIGLGVDFVIHSTTKYLNGHGTATAGCIIGERGAAMQRLWQAMKLIGTNCNPFDAWLTNTGIKTLELRMVRHCSNARTLAAWLEAQPLVAKVNHPSLVTHASHTIAKQQMRDFGGMLSFELHGGLAAGVAFMHGLEFCAFAPTLGDTDTLVLHPATMSHVNVDKALREANGITDGLIRLSVGIEAVSDIMADMERGFAKCGA